MKKRLVVIAIVLLVTGSLAVVCFLNTPSGRPLTGSKAIGIVYVEGPLVGGSSSSGFLSSTVGCNTITGYLQAARNDDSIKALVLRIDSPGGSAGAAQEVAREVEKLRDAGKTVVTSMGDMAASGAYWVASSTDYIVANAGTVTGSIGVVMQFMDYVELYEKIGVRPYIIKSGEHKDMGDPSRPLTEDERLLLQGMVDDIYRQFVQEVSKGRGLPVDTVEALADGRVFTGSQARDEGLVDALGNFEDAIEITADMAGLYGTYTIVEYGRVSALGILLDALGLESRVPTGLRQIMEAYRSSLRVPGY